LNEAAPEHRAQANFFLESHASDKSLTFVDLDEHISGMPSNRPLEPSDSWEAHFTGVYESRV